MNNKKTRYKSKRIEFTPSAKRKIVRDCRNLCAFPDCNKKVVSTKITIKDEQDGWFQGHVAHIYPASAKGKGGFRYDENIPESFIKSPKNGILLCVPHHDEIDDILNKEKYTAEALLRMRENHIIRVKDIPNNLKKINQIDFEPIDTSPEYNDKRIALLETSIRNLIIKYYSENFPPSRNIMISKLLNIINMFRSGYLDMFVKNNLIQHQKLINYHFPEFGKNLFPQIFKQKIKDKEILIKNNVNRDIFVHAGDLAYAIYEKYNEDHFKKKILIDDARRIYNNIIQGRHDYMAMNFDPDIFKECLDILVNKGLIKISDPWTDSNSLETYDVYITERLQQFITKYSLEVLLDSIHQ